MEAQAVVLVLMFGSLLFTGKRNALGLDSVSIILLLLGLHWWVMFVKHVMQHGLGKKQATLLHLVGLCVAFGAILGTHLSLVGNIPSLVLWGALIVWFWQLGIQRVRIGWLDEQLISTFKLGFIVLLALLCLAVTNFASTQVLLSDLAFALPLYFLSGLLALSFQRLSITRRAYLRETPGTNPTRSWFSALTILLGAMVAAIIIVDVFTFQAILLVLQPLLHALGAFFGWLISLLESLLKHQPPPKPLKRKLKVPKSPPPPPPYHNLPLEIVLVVLAVAFLLLILFVVIREWRMRHMKTSEDEEREGLSVRSTLRARRKQRQRRPKFMLEPLDSTSARARYRELLQVMARRGDDLGRRPDETPVEYQARLLTLVENTPGDAAQEDEMPADAAILDALTRTYMRERYGGKSTDQSQRAYLGKWAPWLVKRLTRSKST